MKFLVSAVLIFLTACHDRPTKNEISSPGTRVTEIQPLTYFQTKQEIDSLRNQLKNAYQSANAISRKTVLDSSKLCLLRAVSEKLFAHWQGTPWDFNGISTKPKNGTIACGYFVTTVLKDAGVRLNRTRLSIVPSMIMMKELTSSKSIRNVSAFSYPEFCRLMKNQKNSLFIIGLDFHTGFIVNDGDSTWFIHSNYINKKGVVKELIAESAALRSSRTRYIACLTEDAFLIKWLFH
jgi:hypothetical protein